MPTCGKWCRASAGAFTGTPPETALRRFERQMGRAATIFHTYHRSDQLFPTAAEAAAPSRNLRLAAATALVLSPQTIESWLRSRRFREDRKFPEHAVVVREFWELAISEDRSFRSKRRFSTVP